MKILLVSHEYPPLGGGGGNACMNLAEEYVRCGHEVTIVTAWFEGLKRAEENPGCHIIRVPSKRKHLEHCGFVEMMDYLVRALAVADRMERRESYDVCQVFFAIPSGPVGYYLKKRYGVPYVIRFGGGDIPGFQERFQFIYRLLEPLEKLLWRDAYALVANSGGLKRMAEGFYRKKEITVIPNGVNMEMFPSLIKKEHSDFRLLFVSRLIERKGLQFVLPQLGGLNERMDMRLHLTVVGDGPYRGELERLVGENGLEEIVEFAGQKDKEELSAYYNAADVFIFPSAREGMPNVVLEAMASGLPVVMTPCEGSEELIDGNGFVVRTDEFPDKLMTLYRDAELRRQMGERSLSLVRERFSWHGAALAYQELFERAAGKEREDGGYDV